MDTWLKRYRIRSTIILAMALWMNWRAAQWGMSFAAVSLRSGVDIAAILTAIQAPAVLLIGWAFKVYSESKIP